VAFLVAGAAAQAGKKVTMFLTKEAVRQRSRASPKALPAMAVQRWRHWLHSTPTPAGGCWCAQSA
jgi:predicted peroxiredoxin